MTKKHSPKRPFYRKKLFLGLAGGFVLLIVFGVLAFRFSPWPGAMVVRFVFERGGHKTLVGLQKDIPNVPVMVLKDQQYAQASGKEYLDVYMPNSVMQNAQDSLPVVVWTHGGAWLSGDKADSAPYYKLLAAQGYIVVALNYSLAPEATYPAPVHQINDAYSYIKANAARFHANTSKIVLAGDSAGSQLSSQMAAIITNPGYAKQVGVQPNLTPQQLAGVVLFCGIYKMEGLATPNPMLPKIIGWGNDVTVWSYMGTRDRTTPLIKQASTYYHVTKDFPATFISGGNGDLLTDAQSVPLANELSSLGVNVTSLFYSANHTPSLPHEYQFTFDADGQAAFTKMTQFLQAKTQ